MNRDEDKLQSEIVQWYSLEYGRKHDKCLFLINNNAKKTIEIMRLKALGLKSGVSDLGLIVPKKTIYVELKTSKGIQGPEQKEFERQLKEFEGEYFLIRSLEEFKLLCKKYYN